MEANVKTVETFIKIIFKDGQEYNLPLVNVNYMTDNLVNYGTSVKINEQLYSTSGNNIVGNVCSNSLAIELVSNDKLLISSNEQSPYFGLMNDTAIIDVSVRVEGEETDTFMGRYFVSAWETGTSNSNANKVSISCVDLLSKIRHISLDKIRSYRNMSVCDYLKKVIDELNKNLPESMQILYDEEDLNIYKNSKYEWQIYFNNIDI